MDPNEKDEIATEVSSAVIKTFFSRFPVLREVIAGWDAYKRSNFERNLTAIVTHLENKVENLDSLFFDEWFKSEKGQQFARKIFGCAFDDQLAEKQELFVNALISGIREKELTDLEKFKFVDMLRHLSLAALSVLADMHKIFEENVYRPSKQETNESTYIDKSRIVKKLSSKHHPYLIESAIIEMSSVGLFSDTIGYFENPDGSYGDKGGFSDGYAYTDFTCKFVEFITMEKFK